MEPWLTGCILQAITCVEWTEAPMIIFVKNSERTENHQKLAVCPGDLRFARVLREFQVVFSCKIWQFNIVDSAFNQLGNSDFFPVWKNQFLWNRLEHPYLLKEVYLSVYPSVFLVCPSEKKRKKNRIGKKKEKKRNQSPKGKRWSPVPLPCLVVCWG